MTDEELYTRAHELLEYKEGHLFWKFGRTKAAKGKKAGSVKDQKYIVVTIDANFYLAHRLIFLMHHGFLPNEIDHINRIRSDNRIENLRPATRKENSKNKTIQAKNTSGITGVRWDTDCNKWRASIQVDYKQIYLGLYIEKNEAILARKKAEAKFFGAFAPS